MKAAAVSLLLVSAVIAGSCFASQSSSAGVDRAVEWSDRNEEQSLCPVSHDLESALADYAKDKDARIGVAVIVNHRDTVIFNGRRDFPMMSVFKFPLSLAVAQWVDSRGGSLGDSLVVIPDLMRDNTYSPMFEKYGKRRLTIPLDQLVYWALVHSDNNACDILLDHIGGTAAADSILHQLGIDENITIGATEAQMAADHYLIYLNRSTPLAMANLFDRFDCDLRHKSQSFDSIAGMLEQCLTGTDRLPAALDGNAVIGHKTGTGFTTPEGRLTALNDCGYVRLPNGTTYSITVFIADSAYDVTETSNMIADISRLVLSAVLPESSLTRYKTVVCRCGTRGMDATR